MTHSHLISNEYRVEELIEPSFNLRLIEAVKHYRCLYDPSDRQYRSSEFKTKLWNRLVLLLHFDGDSRALYARWKQLRDKYGKEKRKARYHPEGSTWQYYKYLEFLEPHMVDRSSAQSPLRKENRDVQLVVSDPTFWLSLIAEVRAHPCLFDIRDPKYRHVDCRNQAWSEIIKNLEYPGDVGSIYKQWKKIRDRYVREKRRLRELRERGCDEESSWELYCQLMWMDPYLDDRAQHMKRKHDSDVLSDYGEADEMGASESRFGFHVSEKRPAGADVLLDGDSAFAASAVSELRLLPEHVRAEAKAQIEALFESLGYRPDIYE